MENNSVLLVKNLCVKLGNENIVADLDFEVKKGETFVILGPNGAGKTVLLKTILGIFNYTGSIEWAKGVRIGYVPQRLPFIRDFPLSVVEFLRLKSSSDAEIKEALDAVGLSERFLKKSMSILSSGQFQRLLVAWGILGRPDVLLFDEPTAGVDVGGEETIYALLNKLKKEKNLTVILVTHDLNIIYRDAANVLCLNHKKICYGIPREVLNEQKLAIMFGDDVKIYDHKGYGH